MKQTKLTTGLLAGAAFAVALSTAFAQETTTSTTVPAGTSTTTGVSAGTTGVSAGTSVNAGTTGVSTSTTTTGSTTDGTGTISTYTPGSDYMMFRSEANAAPVRYYYSPKETTVVDSEGATVDWKLLRPDMPVRYTYVKQGDRMVVRKITLTKPISYYEKTTTTTTTTRP